LVILVASIAGYNVTDLESGAIWPRGFKDSATKIVPEDKVAETKVVHYSEIGRVGAGEENFDQDLALCWRGNREIAPNNNVAFVVGIKCGARDVSRHV
jgi:hypothetical protein